MLRKPEQFVAEGSKVFRKAPVNTDVMNRVVPKLLEYLER